MNHLVSAEFKGCFVLFVFLDTDSVAPPGGRLSKGPGPRMCTVFI